MCKSINKVLPLANVRVCVGVCLLTGIDEELIGNSWVIYIMDGCSEESGQDLQVSENCLKDESR